MLCIFSAPPELVNVSKPVLFELFPMLDRRIMFSTIRSILESVSRVTPPHRIFTLRNPARTVDALLLLVYQQQPAQRIFALFTRTHQILQTIFSKKIVVTELEPWDDRLADEQATRALVALIGVWKQE